MQVSAVTSHAAGGGTEGIIGVLRIEPLFPHLGLSELGESSSRGGILVMEKEGNVHFHISSESGWGSAVLDKHPPAPLRWFSVTGEGLGSLSACGGSSI